MLKLARFVYAKLGFVFSSLKYALDKLTKLKTLQLEVTMKSEGYEWNEGLYTTAMTSVISSLPKSITALTGDNPSEPPSKNTLDPNNHHSLCHLLLFPELASSLRQVYIRLGSICPWMFKMNGVAKHSHLETLVINISLDEEFVPLASSLCS